MVKTEMQTVNVGGLDTFFKWLNTNTDDNTDDTAQIEQDQDQDEDGKDMRGYLLSSNRGLCAVHGAHTRTRACACSHATFIFFAVWGHTIRRRSCL